MGAMGRHHARIYNELDGVELVSVADANAELADAVGHRYKLPSYSDYQQMLRNEHLDLVSVVVPTRMHYEVGMGVIQRGVHLLIEKPIASTVGQGKELVQQAEVAGVRLMVGHIERFNPAIIELKRRLDGGELGKIFLVHARRLGPFPPRIRDVGVVIDLATHDLDLMRYLIGADVQRVYSETAQRIHTAHEDLLMGLLRFSDGALGVLDINWLTPTKVRELAVTGERGMFLANYLTQDLSFYENHAADHEWETLGILKGVGEGNMIGMHIEKREPLALELAAFVQAIRTGTSPGATGQDAVAALALAEQLVESGITNRVLQ